MMLFPHSPPALYTWPPPKPVRGAQLIQLIQMLELGGRKKAAFMKVDTRSFPNGW